MVSSPPYRATLIRLFLRIESHENLSVVQAWVLGGLGDWEIGRLETSGRIENKFAARFSEFKVIAVL